MSTTTKKSNKNAVIIGGSPAGFATALMLAKRGWHQITILEKRPASDFYEPDKSFHYCKHSAVSNQLASSGGTADFSYCF
ncbi:hypothetical protein [Okeania sp. KiyG1]|uniref:hypothetical protein n=1 Tax=Okeania sp. KiyG1 TaxID=2720165 RepID=UPI0019217ED6|nr:hypothetical protein [Okeania sp. KiyG1]GGA27252.1 hypothetical protein CYANOKiyG1_43420 [Okeania sp. KiyG1]